MRARLENRDELVTAGERWERQRNGSEDRVALAGSVSQDKEFGLHPKSNGGLLEGLVEVTRIGHAF